MAQHPIVHVEIPANDPQAAAAFYADLFGWQTETNATNDYSMFQAAPGPGGGFPKVDGEYVRPGAVVISSRPTTSTQRSLRRRSSVPRSSSRRLRYPGSVGSPCSSTRPATGSPSG